MRAESGRCRSAGRLRSSARHDEAADQRRQLGYSWDGIQERVKGACVAPGAVITTPYNVAMLTMDQVLTTDQAASTLGYSAEGKAKFGLLGAEAKAKFSRSLAANKFSMSNYFAYDLLTRRESIDLRVDPTWLVSTDDPDCVSSRNWGLLVLNSRTRVCWDDITDPSSAAQVDACVAAVGIPSLAADGYTDGLSLDLVEVAPFLEYQVAQSPCKAGSSWCFKSIPWLSTVPEGGVAGDVAAANGPLPIVGLRVWKTPRLPSTSRICYQLRVRGSWRAEACDGGVSGDTGVNTMLKPQGDQVRIRLEGAPGVRVCYRTYTNGAWTPPVCDWTVAGLPNVTMAGLQIYTIR